MHDVQTENELRVNENNLSRARVARKLKVFWTRNNHVCRQKKSTMADSRKRSNYSLCLLIRSVQFLLLQSEIPTDHDGAAPRKIL